MTYIHDHYLRTNPKAMFRDDLLGLLRLWRSEGDRVILMMDANEHVINGALCRQLRGEDLRMSEAVHACTPGDGPKTWFRGKDSIDGIWFSDELELVCASYLPFHGDIGDHRPVLVDFTVQSLLGLNLPRIVHASARRLNSSVERIRQPYID